MLKLKIENATSEPPETVLQQILKENQSFFNILNDAYCKSVAKRVAFKQLSCDGKILGYYVASLKRFSIDKDVSENYDEYKYFSLHLDLIYILPQYRKHNIGTVTMYQFLLIAKNVSAHTGCRFVTIDAIKELEEWYTRIGFVNTNIKGNLGGTTKMFFDMRDKTLYDSYYECP